MQKMDMISHWKVCMGSTISSFTFYSVRKNYFLIFICILCIAFMI